MLPMQSLLILGCGYVGEKLAMACLAKGMQVQATTRSSERAAQLKALGIDAFVVSSPVDLSDDILASVDGVVDSIPLNRDGQDMQALQPQWVSDFAARCSRLQWVGYLSTTGVYGDAGGAWVDESWPCQPSSQRGSERLLAEQAWLQSDLPAEVFRLAGIYGPERNIIGRLRAGGYQTVAWQPAHYSSRIHVDDIVMALMAAMQAPKAGRIVNVADDLPLPHADYVGEVADMMGITQPEILTEQQAIVHLSATMLDFFRDNKRVSNQLLHDELLAQLKYPDFRCGMRDLIK